MTINSIDVKASRMHRSIDGSSSGLLLFVGFIRQKVMMVDDIVRVQQATEGVCLVFSSLVRSSLPL